MLTRVPSANPEEIRSRYGECRDAYLAAELNADRKMHGGSFAVQLCRLVLPLLDRFQRRLVEQSRTRNNCHGTDIAVGINEGVNLDAPEICCARAVEGYPEELI